MDCIDEKQLYIIHQLHKHAKKKQDECLYFKIDDHGIFTLVWKPRYSFKQLFERMNMSVIKKDLYVTYGYPSLRIQGHDTLYDLQDVNSPIREYYYVFMKNLEPLHIKWRREKYTCNAFWALKRLYTDTVLPNEEHVTTIKSINDSVALLHDNIMLSVYINSCGVWMEWEDKEYRRETHLHFEMLVGIYKYNDAVPAFVAERYNWYINRYTTDHIRIRYWGKERLDDTKAFKEKLLYALQHLYDADIMVKSAFKK
tara:strand:- start:5542 stop:6306 length:765 start_codon:yes stop_codon:yes gene_type:complete